MLVVPGTSLPGQRHQPGISTWLEPFMNPYLPHNHQHPSVWLYNTSGKYFDASKIIFYCVFTKICIANGCVSDWLPEVSGWLGGWEGSTGQLSELSGQSEGAPHQLTENIVIIPPSPSLTSGRPVILTLVTEGARRHPGWCRHLDQVLMLVIRVKRSCGTEAVSWLLWRLNRQLLSKYVYNAIQQCQRGLIHKRSKEYQSCP